VSASSCCRVHLERVSGCTQPNEACFTALRTLESCVCRECIHLVKEIGAVEHVVLTTHAYEHKIFVAPFARKFPGESSAAGRGYCLVSSASQRPRPVDNSF